MRPSFFKKIKQPGELRINEDIRVSELRLIDEDGSQLGVFRLCDALTLAKEKGFDLVEIVPGSKPPVAKIMDYGKYLYAKKKQARKQRARSKKNEVKGIRIGVATSEHDLATKRKRAEEFLGKDFKVSIEILLKGREKMFQDKAKKSLSVFLSSIQIPNVMENPIKKTPQGYNVLIRKK